MKGLQFTLNNIMKSPLQGYQLAAVAVSARGYSDGFSESFYALIDTGAYHTCISKSLMDKILTKVLDEAGNPLQEVGEANAVGVYGGSNREPIYVLPHFYLGGIHLTNVAITVLNTKNIQCLVGRSILHQCVLTLNPELNNLHFNFVEGLKEKKQLIDGIEPFTDVSQFAEWSTLNGLIYSIKTELTYVETLPLRWRFFLRVKLFYRSNLHLSTAIKKPPKIKLLGGLAFTALEPYGKL